MKLQEIAGSFSILRYPPNAQIPHWVLDTSLFSITKTNEELSIVCGSGAVQPGFEKREDDWSCLKVVGPLDFSLTGILSSLTAPLAEQKISVFAFSTFDTDYLLVKTDALPRALETLSRSHFQIERAAR